VGTRTLQTSRANADIFAHKKAAQLS